MIRRLRQLGGGLVTLAVLLLLLFFGWAAMRGKAQDLPWTPLDLGEPVGLSTGRKLAALTDDFPRCTALMRRAGIRYTALPPRHDGPSCGYDDGVRLTAGGPRALPFAPADLRIACPVAAALAMWEWTGLQAAAREELGERVVAIEHLGSYNCRRMYGRGTGSWSEHATADAVDIAGFRLSNGERVTILADWQGDGPRARFLHRVRDDACGLFSTVLSPDYNAAHRDHLHLDQAARGAASWRSCR